MRARGVAVIGLWLVGVCGCGNGSVAVEIGPRAGDVLVDPGVAADDVFSVGAPDAARVSVDRLRALIDAAASYRSDGLVVAIDDTIVVERYFGQPRGAHNIQSVTKSVDALAIGALLDDGRLPALDEPVGDFYPDWQSGDKAQVTLKELMTHTSGLQDSDGAAAANNALAFARGLTLAHVPGTTFDYSNAGVQLLSGIIAQAAGMGVDQLVDRTFFAPMGITDWQWGKDLAGNVDTPGGLFLTARELLRLGRLLRDHGAWNGAQLVSGTWIDQLGSSQSAAAPCYGLLWWLERDGCTTVRPPYGPTRAVYALGWGGQYIVVVPSARMIVVRTRDPIDESQADEEATFFEELPDLVVGLTG
jgi:CubicO group peptidase (beta-lactamase class C family)